MRDYVVFIDQSPCGLVLEVQPLTPDFAVGLGDPLDGLSAAVTAFLAAGNGALLDAQLLQAASQVAGIFDELPI